MMVATFRMKYSVLWSSSSRLIFPNHLIAHELPAGVSPHDTRVHGADMIVFDSSPPVIVPVGSGQILGNGPHYTAPVLMSGG